jgi:hypothetical protein
MALRPGVKLDAEEIDHLGDVTTGLLKLEKLPGGPITPLVFSLNRHSQLETLLDPNRTVSFDLRGRGVVEKWPWLQPDAALLVWDPHHEGHIKSGRQLFGSATFQLVNSDGFKALQWLDDNQDGQISGDELTGLCAWFDRNGNGVSDPGEVVPLSELGVVSISVRGALSQGPYLVNPTGITLKDGTRLPLWDWVAKPVVKPPIVAKAGKMPPR